MSLSEKNIQENRLELYIKYENLDINILLEVFYRLEQMHEKILKTTSPVYFNELTQERFRNILELADIATGQSIRIKLNEKWKIELPFNMGEIKGKFPKKLGVPIIITFFLLLAARQGMRLYNDYLDSELKKLEIELRRNELFQRMEERKGISSEFRMVEREAKRVIRYIEDNPDIRFVEVNGISIKNN